MVVVDREFVERDIKHQLIVELIARNWGQNFVVYRAGRFSWELVREFFANIREQGRGEEGFTWVRGVTVDFRPEVINRVLGLMTRLDIFYQVRILLLLGR